MALARLDGALATHPHNRKDNLMGTLHTIRPAARQAQVAKPQLRPLARLDVEQARQFVLELDMTTTGCDRLRAMFLLGRCAEHAQALLDVLDAVVAL